ncbi:hypothetical protein PT974_00965 [Cladobotryum mycophilum]|uniref:Tafazzin n=1 Tax=Cladobotryum mycophilum TaxID=491253 RepID=A0ABR0T2X3_9HYPO
MPKKRQHLKSFKPSLTGSAVPGTSSPNSSGKAPKGVNELLASLRHASIDSSASRPLHAITPTVPPALREILQIPETPPPAPRLPLRARVDNNGRRLPAGPPPPRSWVAARNRNAAHADGTLQSSTVNWRSLAHTTLPGTFMPSPGSLIDLVLRKLATDWDYHRVYDQYHIFFVPGHLKSALIRWVGIANPAHSLSSPNVYDEEDFGPEIPSNAEINYLDLSGSVGRTITLKEISELLHPLKKVDASDELQDTWDAVGSAPSPPKALLPNLTHLSLALDPKHASDASWKQLLAMSARLSSVTHLSLAYWPDPCLTPRARYSTVATPQGTNVPYGGTNLYSHSIDHDWSEALLVLRMLSKNLYALEFLDLTGCAPWFKALMMHSEHDFIDWSRDWGKISVLKLYAGWSPGKDTMPSEWESYREAIETSGNVAKHIRAMRAGKGRFITVERDAAEIHVS